MYRTYIVVLFVAILQAQPVPPDDPANVIVSTFAAKDWDLTANPEAVEWIGGAGIYAAKGFFGDTSPLPPTEIRSRWTRKNLYLLFICPYKSLNLKRDPVTTEETNKLWNWDVAEAFIGSDYLRFARYKEFQMSPQGEFVDLDIDQDDPKPQPKALEWQSGFTVRASIDSHRKIWYGEMCIPFSSLDVKTPKAGDELRVGFYRIAGKDPHRIYITWRPTGANTFHVPAAFGTLALR